MPNHTCAYCARCFKQPSAYVDHIINSICDLKPQSATNLWNLAKARSQHINHHVRTCHDAICQAAKNGKFKYTYTIDAQFLPDTLNKLKDLFPDVVFSAISVSQFTADWSQPPLQPTNLAALIKDVHMLVNTIKAKRR
jgi:hypothetical protein